MSYVIPGNVLWYFFQGIEQRKIFGTPLDCMEKFRILEKANLLSQGLEIYLIPHRLRSFDEFEPWFYSKYSRLKYKTVHIGDQNEGFLIDSDKIYNKLEILSKMLERLEVDTIILHANHLLHEQKTTKELLDSVLPGTTVCVENTGFGSKQGSGIEDLVQIFKEYPKYKLCLDVCHIYDYVDYSLEDFFSVEMLRSRIVQIHFSYSTRFDKENLYAKIGFRGHKPYHALWSVIGKFPSRKSMDFLRKYPIVIEGAVPMQDKSLQYLRREVELINS